MSSLNFARPDGSNFPPAGVRCVDCGCCYANVYAGNDPLCWACDAGTHGPKKEQPAAKPARGGEAHETASTLNKTVAAAGDRVVAAQPEKRAAVPHVLTVAPIHKEESMKKRVSDEIRIAIQSAPPEVKNRDLEKKYNLSSATISVIRRGKTWSAKPATGGGQTSEEGSHTARAESYSDRTRSVSAGLQCHRRVQHHDRRPDQPSRGGSLLGAALARTEGADHPGVHPLHPQPRPGGMK